MNLSGKRLLICEEALIGYGAHYYSWIKSIRELNQKEGVEVVVAGNLKMDEAITTEFSAHRTYSVNNWSGVYNYPQTWKRYLSVFKHNYLVYQETAKLLKDLEPVDCLMLPAVRIHHLIAWRFLCARFLKKKFNRLVVFILTSEASYDQDYSAYYFKRSAVLIKWALKSFKSLAREGHVLMAGDSHITCEEYESLSGLPFTVFPSPGVALAKKSESLPDSQNSESSGPVFVIMGVSYYDKGIDLFQEAVLRYLREHPDGDARFIIQWGTKTIDPHGTEIPIHEELRRSSKVTLLEKSLTNEEYTHYFKQADFVCLPYRKKSYFNRSSGVFIEAACSAVPLIVTENTWLSWALKEFGAGVTVKHEDADDLYRKMLFCMENRAALAKEAAAARPRALQINSSENYLRCLWETGA